MGVAGAVPLVLAVPVASCAVPAPARSDYGSSAAVGEKARGCLPAFRQLPRVRDSVQHYSLWHLEEAEIPPYSEESGYLPQAGHSFSQAPRFSCPFRVLVPADRSNADHQLWIVLLF